MTLIKWPSIGLMILIFVAVAMALLGPSLSVDLTWSHAEKHGEVTAQTIRRLCDNGGVLRTYQVDKFRYAQVCKIDAQQYGCRIVDLLSDGTWSEVTAFIKSAFTGKSIEQIDEAVAKKFWSCVDTDIR